MLPQSCVKSYSDFCNATQTQFGSVGTLAGTETTFNIMGAGAGWQMSQLQSLRELKILCLSGDRTEVTP